MIKIQTVSICLLFILSGCATHEPAQLRDGVISSAVVGWNGYSVKVPSGVQRLKESADENVPSREEEIRRRYREANERYVADYYASNYNQFLFENPEQTYFISFISESYSLSRGWNAMSSVDKQYIIQKLINRKKVVLNDTRAHAEQIEINGQRGWYISGSSRPYFRKHASLVPYEGIFLVGDLKEGFWFEAFGEEGARSEMKTKVFEMAESLEVK